MPTVRTYGERKVSRAPLPGARRQASDTDLSLGVGVEQARAQKFGAMARVTGALAQQAEQIVEQQTLQADQVAVLAEANELTRKKQGLVQDAYGVKGKDAVAQTGVALEAYRGFANERLAKLGNPRQRAALARQIADHELDISLVLERHGAEQLQAYENTELQAFVENTTSEAISLALDPEKVAPHVRRLSEAMTRHYPRQGLGPDEIQRKIEVARTVVHVGVIKALVDAGYDASAQEYLDKNKEFMRGDAQNEMTALVEKETTDAVALKLATDVFEGMYPPGDDTAVVQMDVMARAVREQLTTQKNGMKYLEPTLQWLRVMKIEREDGKQQRAIQIKGDLWKLAAQAMQNRSLTITAMHASHAYKAADPLLQKEVDEWFLNEREQQVDRDYTLSQRAEEKRTRPTDAQFRAYYELTRDPQQFVRKNENQVWLELPRLGTALTAKAMELHRDYTKSAQTVHDATIDTELFNSELVEAGFHPYDPKLSEDEKTQIGQLKNGIEDLIAQAQRGSTRLDRTAKQKMFREMIAQKVLQRGTGGWIWGGDQSVVGAGILPKDRAAAYIPIAEIAADNLKDLLNIIQGAPGNAHLSHAQLQPRYRARIEHAWALRLMGATSKEIVAELLKGDPQPGAAK